MSTEMWQPSLDSSAVIALRSTKLAQGGTAAMIEASEMVTEMIGAAVEAQTKLMSGVFGGPGTAPAKLVRHYSGKVRANRRRLGR